jgi:hypothetical protein
MHPDHTAGSAVPQLMRWQYLKAAALCLLLLAGHAAAETGNSTVKLGIDEARVVGEEALATGNPALAARIARGLLQRDDSDIGAWLMLGWAEIALRRPDAAGDAGSAAFRAAKGVPRARFAAAMLSAKAAYDGGRLTAAQFWLRRAGDAATSPEERAQAVAGFRSIRQQNKWSAVLNFSASPSSNINGGARETALTIDGRPITIGGFPLTNNGEARALSGLEATLDLSFSYRLSESAKQQTSLGFRLYGATYALSDEAKRQTEESGTTGSDFAFTLVEASLRHVRLPASGKGTLSFGASLAQSWYGGQILNHSARIDVARAFPLGPNNTAQIAASLEQSISDTDDDRTLLGTLQGQVVMPLESGATLQFSAGLSGTESNDRRNEYVSLRGGVTYTLAKPVGPAEVTLGLSVSSRHYPATSVGSFNPEERNDLRVTGTVEMLLPKAEVMGFAPTVTLSAGRTWSNASRFETEDLGVAFGLKSTF